MRKPESNRISRWRLAALVGVLALIGASVAQARMYQWVNPWSRSPQLSGTPPSWYRSAEGGPRVQVFENGNLVDDTAIPLPRAQAQELRDAAFHEFEQRQREESLRQLERAAQKERRRQEEQERLARQQQEASRSSALASREAQQEPESKVLVVPQAPAELTAEEARRLKALLTDFDRQGGGLKR